MNRNLFSNAKATLGSDQWNTRVHQQTSVLLYIRSMTHVEPLGARKFSRWHFKNLYDRLSLQAGTSQRSL
jgi:hypothetical protein